MKERPILFSAPMVRAILEGRKTQTRQVIKPQPTVINKGHDRFRWKNKIDTPLVIACDVMAAWSPYGLPCDRLWVRETWADVHPLLAEGRYSQPGRAGIPGPPPVGYRVIYRADGDTVPPLYHSMSGYPHRTTDRASAASDIVEPFEWEPSIHMCRWMSRITLEVTGVRVERVQDISGEDAKAEGITPDMETHAGQYWREDAIIDFSALWDSINAARGYGWDANPWVWVVEFRRAQP